MTLTEALILAVGLSMDAFAVAVCKGLAMRRASLKNMLIIGLYFGLFQAIMPLLGYFLGTRFAVFIEAFDHWIAFALLGFLGIRMIRESRNAKCCDSKSADADLSFRVMLTLAIATSIDALAVGTSLAFLRVDIVPIVVSIGVITFALSMVGVKVGHAFGQKWEWRAQMLGGCILILIGANILVEHLQLF